MSAYHLERFGVLHCSDEGQEAKMAATTCFEAHVLNQL